MGPNVQPSNLVKFGFSRLSKHWIFSIIQGLAAFKNVNMLGLIYPDSI